MNKLQLMIESKIGPLYLTASSKGLHSVSWDRQDVPMADGKNDAATKILQKSATQIKEFLSGKRKKFELPLEAEGTAFQKKVWKELAKIPYGETRSYKDIAIAIKNAKACRAVGTANGRNPLAVIVPCHRVIAHDGGIGGYGGGLGIKRRLLALEKYGKMPN